MSSVRRRIFAGTTGVLLAFSPLLLNAHAASAFPKGDSVIAFDYNVVATTHVKKADQTIKIGGGKFNGEVDFDTAQLAGHMKLPPVTFTFTEGGIGLVTATAAIVETKAITGKVNLNNFRVTATATFNMLLLSMYPAQPNIPPITIPGIGQLPLPTLPPLPKVNLVGKHCTTETPISVTMSGKVTIGATNTLTGALNQLIPGPGNTFSATASPA
jgi:hypothetical protein